MKQIFIFWLCIISFGCENINHEPKSSQTINRLQLEGDFDGDSILDTIKESYFSKVTQKEILKFQFDNHTTQVMIDSFIERNQPRSSVYILGKNNNIQGIFYKNDYPTFGISGMVNLGNIDNKKGDEIGIVIGSADYSLVSSCEVLSYKSNQWIKINSFQIHESQIWDNQLQKTVMFRNQRRKKNEDLGTERRGVFFKDAGKVYAYYYDPIGGQIVESIL